MRETQRVSGDMGPVGGAFFWLAIGAACACLVVGILRGDASFNLWEALAAIATSIGVLVALRQGRLAETRQRLLDDGVRRRASASFLVRCLGLNARLWAALKFARELSEGVHYPDAHQDLLTVIQTIHLELERERNTIVVHLPDTVAYRVEVASQALIAALEIHRMSTPVYGLMNEAGIRAVTANMLSYADAAYRNMSSAIDDAEKFGSGVREYWPVVDTVTLGPEHYQSPYR